MTNNQVACVASSGIYMFWFVFLCMLRYISLILRASRMETALSNLKNCENFEIQLCFLTGRSLLCPWPPVHSGTGQVSCCHPWTELVHWMEPSEHCHNQFPPQRLMPALDKYVSARISCCIRIAILLSCFFHFWFMYTSSPFSKLNFTWTTR